MKKDPFNQIIRKWLPKDVFVNLLEKYLGANTGFEFLKSYLKIFVNKKCVKWFLLQKQSSRGVLCEKVFLEISQNSQENTCARVSFLIKKGLQLYFKKRLWHRPATLLKKRLWHRPTTLLKRGSGTGVFLRILWNF